MSGREKTKKALREELEALRCRVAELERIEAEYKRTEQSLLKSEEWYARAERIGHFGHWVRSCIEDKATWSEECYRICGVTRGEFEPSYENFLNLIHPCDKDLFKRAFEDAISYSRPFDIEYRMVRPDGTERVVHSVAEVHLDKSGQPLKVVGTAHDITERKWAEEELRKAHSELEAQVERRTASLAKINALLTEQIAEREQVEEALRVKNIAMESSVNAIAFADMAGALTYVNKSFLKLWGYGDEKEVLGRAAAEFWADVDKAAEIRETAWREGGWAGELVAKRKDGSTFEVRLSTSLVRDEGGHPICTMGSFIDITESNKTERALRASEERFRNIFAESPIGIELYDSKGHLLDANKASLDIFGVDDISEVRGFKLLEDPNLPDETKERLRKGEEVKFEAAFDFEKVKKAKLYKTRRSGITWLDVMITPLGLEGTGPLTGYLIQVEDITERKKAENALRESEDKYKTLLVNLPQRIFLKDRDSVYVSCNDNLARDLNIRSEEIAGKTDYDFFSKELAEKYRADDKRIIESGETTDIDESYVWRGQERIVHTVKTPVKDIRGNVLGILGIFWDITERKRAEDALRESEERYKALFEGAAEGILVADVETKRFRYANPAVCKMLGYTEEELTRLRVMDVHPKEDLEQVLCEFGAQARGEKTLAPDIPCLRKDGAIIYADIDSARILIDGRECNVGFFTDVTERKKAAEELYRAEAKYRTLVEQIPAVTYVAALDRASTTLYVSPQIETLIGFSPEEYEADRDIWRKRLHPDDRERVMAELERSHRGAEPFCSEYRMVTRSGRVAWFRDEATVVRDSENRPLFLQGVMLDITDRKQAEGALQKARDTLETRVGERTADLARVNEELRKEISERKKAEEKLLAYEKQLRRLAAELMLAEERARRRIATNVHDHISQNLAVSKVKLESLQESVASPEVAAVLEETRALIAEAIERARSLTFELSPPVLYELGFEAAVEWLVRQTRQRHGLAAEFRDDGRPKPLDGNVRVLLFRAVQELLFNVAKHARARNVTVSTRRVGNQIRVSVEDDGVGFDASPSGSRGYKTGGFGLFSVRERLDHIGGYLDIESKPGLGTRVTLVAPIDHETLSRKEQRK